MNHVDLFSGIGGFSLAASWVWGEDHNVVCFCEQDKFCQKVINKHWPGTPIVNDIKELTLDTFVNLCYTGLSDNEKEIINMVAKRKNYDEAVNMYERGLSIQGVANFYGVTRQAMWMTLKRRGCKFRSNFKYGKDNHFFRGGDKASDRVHNIVELAVEKGILIRPVRCATCSDSPTFKDGRTAIQAHHDDYNKPLDVRWLCKKCHYDWHSEHKAKQLEIELPTMTREEICSLGGKASNAKRWGKKNLGNESDTSTNVDLLTAGVP